jgi:hypothetical protein
MDRLLRVPVIDAFLALCRRLSPRLGRDVRGLYPGLSLENARVMPPQEPANDGDDRRQVQAVLQSEEPEHDAS